MARYSHAKNPRIRHVLVCLRRGKPGAVGVGMVLKSIFRQAGVSARWVSEGGLARAKRGRIDAVVVGGGDGDDAPRGSINDGVGDSSFGDQSWISGVFDFDQGRGSGDGFARDFKRTVRCEHEERSLGQIIGWK